MNYIEELRKIGINLTHTSGGKKYKCPNCSHSKKNRHAVDLSVTIQQDRVLYQCHNGCGLNGVVFMNSYKRIEQKTYKRPSEPPQIEQNESMYKYFESRKISRETVDKFKIVYTEHFFPQTQKNESCIAFPYYKNGELVNHKYRNAKKNFAQDKEAEQVYFGIDQITDFSYVVHVEGEFDVLALHEAGIQAISVSTGGADTKLDCIENCYEWLEQFETHIIAVDNDETGFKLRDNLVSRLGKSKCKIAEYKLMDGETELSYKDANEILMERDDGIEFLKTVIALAKEFPVENITRVSDAYDSIIDFRINGLRRGLSTGWDNLDRLFNIQTGYLMVLTGKPSSGKSSIHKNMLLNLSINNEWKHLLFDKESDIKVTTANLIKILESQANFNNIPVPIIKERIEFLSEYFYFLPNDKDWNIDEILDKTEEAVRRYGIKTLTIDPYNRLSHDYSSGLRSDLYIENFLGKVIHYTKKLDIFTTIVAHPIKIPKDQKAVTLYDISGAAAWYNMTDYGVIYDRGWNGSSYSDKTDIHVQKVKEFHLGDPSGGKTWLIKENGKFVNKETKGKSYDTPY